MVEAVTVEEEQAILPGHGSFGVHFCDLQPGGRQTRLLAGSQQSLLHWFYTRFRVSGIFHPYPQRSFQQRFSDHRFVLIVVDIKTGAQSRSEEHTSELQSLMRNAYAVLCLEKKT